MRPAVSRAQDKSTSLGDQIEQLERLVALRQERVRGQAKALAQDVRDRLSSPATLLTAAGIGFTAGIISGRFKASRAGPQDASRPASQEWRGIALNWAINALHLAIPVIMARFFPASEPSAPQTDSAIYGQPLS